MHKVLKSFPEKPGVYHFLDKLGKILYIGKAKNLKRRINQYFDKNHTDLKIIQLINQIDDINITVTNTEFEALLLEAKSIKHYLPKYNIVFRDDKSYPYLLLQDSLGYPQLGLYRGDKSLSGEYYGPYSDVKKLREALVTIQQIFKLRQCDDLFFKQRKRPCLQYQLNLCTAPCVGYINTTDYNQAVKQVKGLLNNKSGKLMQNLMHEMQQASDINNYELAAKIRDKINSIKFLQEQSKKTGLNSVDCLGISKTSDLCCIHILHIRDSEINSTSQKIFSLSDYNTEDDDILATFISQYYSSQEKSSLPKYLLFSENDQNLDYINELLKVLGLKKLLISKNNSAQKWLALSNKNANISLTLARQSPKHLLRGFLQLREELALDDLPKRIECFDVSHTQGNNPVASCVVLNVDGWNKSEFRRFLIKNLNKPGDDYAALKEALTRHYEKRKTNNLEFPDLVLIDGGKGQLKQAMLVFRELQINNQVELLSIAKGEGRKSGLEKIYRANLEKFEIIGPLSWDSKDSGFHILQMVRDESHRFALSLHKKRRGKESLQSILLSIPGIGAKKLKVIYQYLGGYQEIKAASQEQLAQVPGISKNLAESIYKHIHMENNL